MFYKDCFYIHKKFGPCKFVSEEGGKIIVEFFYSALRREKVEEEGERERGRGTKTQRERGKKINGRI